jgi:hypothetical protein
MINAQQGGHGYFAGLSLYADRFRRWSRVFGNDAIFIVKTEDLRDPYGANSVLAELCKYLGIRAFDFSEVLTLSINIGGQKDTLDPELRKSLYEYCADDVKALEEITGRKFNWEP